MRAQAHQKYLMHASAHGNAAQQYMARAKALSSAGQGEAASQHRKMAKGHNAAATALQSIAKAHAEAGEKLRMKAMKDAVKPDEVKEDIEQIDELTGKGKLNSIRDYHGKKADDAESKNTGEFVYHASRQARAHNLKGRADAHKSGNDYRSRNHGDKANQNNPHQDSPHFKGFKGVREDEEINDMEVLGEDYVEILDEGNSYRYYNADDQKRKKPDRKARQQKRDSKAINAYHYGAVKEDDDELDEGKTYREFDDEDQEKKKPDRRERQRRREEKSFNSVDEQLNDLARAVIEKKPLDFQERFNEFIQARAAERLDDLRVEVAQATFNVEEEVEQIDELTGKGKLEGIRDFHGKEMRRHGRIADKLEKRGDEHTADDHYEKEHQHLRADQRARALIRQRNTAKAAGEHKSAKIDAMHLRPLRGNQ